MALIVKLDSSFLDEAMVIETSCFTDPWSRKMLSAEIEDPATFYLAALDKEGKLAAYAGMKIVLDEGHIHNVAVAPAYRRRGIARTMIQALVAHAKEQRFSCLFLEVRACNDAAIALYHSLGFKKLATRRDYYKNPREDAVVMMLDLGGCRQS